jgi:hypothetical protein
MKTEGFHQLSRSTYLTKRIAAFKPFSDDRFGKKPGNRLLPISRISYCPGLRRNNQDPHLDAKRLIPAQYRRSSLLNLPDIPQCGYYPFGYLSKNLKFPLETLPPVMGESFVGLGHFMGIFLLLEGSTCIIIRIQQFRGKPFFHAMAGTGTGCGDNPPHSQRFPPGFPDFNRNLIGSAPDTPGFNFYNRLYIINGLEKHFQGLFFGLCLKYTQGLVHYTQSYGTLAIPHHAVYKFGNHHTVVHGIRGYAPV